MTTPRPSGNPYDWASDATLTAGPQAGQSNKVTPPGGVISQGWTPGFKRSAQMDNVLVRNLKGFGTYHDAFEVENFAAGVHSSTSVLHAEKQTLLSWAPKAPTGLAGSEGRLMLFSGTNEYSSQRGETWFAENSGLSIIVDAATDGVISGTTPARVLAVSPASGTVDKYIAGSVSTLAVAAALRHDSALWAPTFSVFLAGGVPLAGPVGPSITSFDHGLTTPTLITLTVPAGYTTSAANMTIDMLATDGAGHLVAIPSHTGGTANLAIYTSSNGTSWTLHQPTLTSQAAACELFWDGSTSLFWLATTDGNLYSSSDGTAWTAAAYTIPVDGTKFRAMAVYGSIWCGVMGGNMICYSLDQGATWKLIPHPFPLAAGDITQYPVQKIRACADGRFAALGEALNNTDPHWISFSIRV